MSEDERSAQQVEWLKGLSRGYEKELEFLVDLPANNDKLTKVEDLKERMGKSMREAEQVLPPDDFFEYEGLYTTLIQILSSLRKELKDIEVPQGEMTVVVIKKQIDDLKKEFKRADGKGVLDQYPSEDKLRALDDLLKTITDLKPVAEKVLGPDHPDVKELKWFSDVFRATKKETERDLANLKEVTKSPVPVEQAEPVASMASPVEQVEVAREELPKVNVEEPEVEPVVEDEKEQKEEAGDFEKETGENGRKMVEAIKALLEREDLSGGDFGVKGNSGLANLRIDIKTNLSRFLDWSPVEKLAVKKEKVDGNNFNPLDLLYGVVNADVGGELGKEIEQELKPLFEERFGLLNSALKEKGESAMQWYHPSRGELINQEKDYPIPDSAERSEEVSLGRIVSIEMPGRVQKYHYEDGSWSEIVRSPSKIIMSSGR